MTHKPKPDDPSLPLGQHHVTMSNDVISASQGLRTLAEQRIIKTCVAMLDSAKLDQGRYTFHLSALEYAEVFGIDIDVAYEQLKLAAKTLLDRIITKEEPAARGRLRVTKARWLSSITYEDGAGYIKLRFSHEATPYLFALKGNHTTYILDQAAQLRSVYSWRLMEMLMQFKNTGWRQINIEDFAKAMDVPPSLTKDFAQIRRRVIEPAIKELTQKDGWIIEWEPLSIGSQKIGRKITALRFTFKKNPQQSLDINL